MRLMKRNQTAIYYCLYKGKEPLLDEDGNETSEYRVLYERPVKLMCSVSHATGYAQVNMLLLWHSLSSNYLALLWVQR